MPEEKKGKYWKFAVVFVALVALALVVFAAARVYEKRSADQQGNNVSQTLQKAIDDYNARLMADTYGGKTPQATLQMYIDAVEKGDYVLASKYFIADNQAKELQSFEGTTNEKINTYINLLKGALKSDGVYALNNSYFSISRPISVDMQLYPNGIWKIIEI
jgi:uncharacterized protein YpmS